MIQKIINTTTKRNNINNLISLSKKCKTLNQLKQIHAHILKSPSPQKPLAISQILSAAAISRNPSFFPHARAIFDNLDHRNAFAYNTIIRGLVQSRSPADALSCYMDMLNCSVKANNFTFPALIKACTLLGTNAATVGRLVHAHVVKFSFQDDPFVSSALIEFYSLVIRDMRTARSLFDKCPVRDVVLWTTMIDRYGKMGEIKRARELFDEMPERNAVSWSAVMAAYSRLSNFSEVIRLFSQMLEAGTKPNESVLVSVLTACANIGAVTQGLWVHSYAKRNKLESNPILATALVNMYSKCGLVDSALAVFEGMAIKDVEAWNAMITGFSINGQASKSLDLFHRMTYVHTIRPTGTTFIAVLTACTHAKFVNEGLKLFDEMGTVHGVEHQKEHYACIVDLLGRAGMVEEAEKFVDEKMGGLQGWGPNVWGALLGACRVHGKVEVGNRVWKKMVESGVSDCGTHILSYNMYREAGWGEKATRVRKMMSETGMEKQPGCSVIEVNGVVEEFLAGDIRHRRAQELVRTLESFSRMVNLEDVFD